MHQEAFLSKQHSLQKRCSTPTLCAYDTQTIILPTPYTLLGEPSLASQTLFYESNLAETIINFQPIAELMCSLIVIEASNSGLL